MIEMLTSPNTSKEGNWWFAIWRLSSLNGNFIDFFIRKSICPKPLHSGRSIFFRHFLICTAADQYFSVNFLSAQRQTNIFLSISYLHSGRSIFFRQFLVYIHPDQYFSVYFLSVSILKKNCHIRPYILLYNILIQ